MTNATQMVIQCYAGTAMTVGDLKISVGFLRRQSCERSVNTGSSWCGVALLNVHPASSQFSPPLSRLVRVQYCTVGLLLWIQKKNIEDTEGSI